MPARRSPLAIRDRTLRLIGVPLAGLVIPRLTGLFGGLTWHDAAYWWGTLWFVGMAFAVWQGNRWLYFRLRHGFAWFQSPSHRLLWIVLTNALYTVPVAVGLLTAWYAIAPLPAIDWKTITIVTLVILLSVLFITHAYEAVFLLQENVDERLRRVRLERARLQTELDAMKSQLAPHFLFNCLATLSHLIEHDPATSRLFIQNLADVCQYLLTRKDRDLVPLVDELVFSQAYASLAELRYPGHLRIALRGFENAGGHLIPPASLQTLLENAIKHNRLSNEDPLPVDVTLADGRLVISNPVRPVAPVAPSTGIGLRNLQERYLLLIHTEVRVEHDGGWFKVTLPLVQTRPARTFEPAPETPSPHFS